jgi:nicotinamidase-related amidase
MQPDFEAAQKAIKPVIAEIKKAKANNEFIFIVEYDGFSPTYGQILHAVKGYRKSAYIVKWANDGSAQIMEAARRLRVSLSRVKMCGVNLSYCVYETAFGLAISNKSYKVKILTDATNCCNHLDYAKSQIKQWIGSVPNLKAI